MMHRRSGDDRLRGIERRELLKDPDRTMGRLRIIPMFEGLSPEQYMKLLRICSKKNYHRNERIFEIGEESAEMFILIQGRLQIMLGESLTIDDHGPSGMVGEMGVITGDRRAARVTALTDCVVLAFDREELLSIFRHDSELQIKVLTNIIRDLSRKALRDDETLNEMRRRRNLIVI